MTKHDKGKVLAFRIKVTDYDKYTVQAKIKDEIGKQLLHLKSTRDPRIAKMRRIAKQKRNEM